MPKWHSADLHNRTHQQATRACALAWKVLFRKVHGKKNDLKNAKFSVAWLPALLRTAWVQ